MLRWRSFMVWMLDLDSVRKWVRLAKNPGKSVCRFIEQKTRGHPELQTRLVFWGRKIFGAQLLQPQACAILDGERNDRLLHVPSHDPATQYKVGDVCDIRIEI